MKKGQTRLGIIIATLMLIVACFAGCGSKDISTIGISQIVDHPSLNVCRQGAIDKLEELGYVDGENIHFKIQDAQGDPSVANAIAQEYVSDNVDVILAIATPNAQAAYAVALDKVPVVFSAVSAPEEAGLAAKDGSTLHGVTGTSDKLPVSATFELINRMTPDAVKVGILHNTGEVNSDVLLAEAREKAGEYNLEIVDVGITSTNEIASALDVLLPKVDVMMNLMDNMVVSALPLVIQKCDDAMIPLYGSEDTQVSAGALASAGVDYYQLGQTNGEMIAAILEGKPAEEIAIANIEQPVLTVNANQLALHGLAIPDEIKDQVTLVETTQSEE